RLHRCAHLRFDPGPVVLGTEQLRPRPFGLDLDSVRFPAGRTHGAPPVSGGVQQPLLPETRGSVRCYTGGGTLPRAALRDGVRLNGLASSWAAFVVVIAG